MRASWIVVAVGLLAASANGAIKRWTGPNNNYDNTKNWMGGSLPCAADNATFSPTWSPTTVFIQNNIEVNSLILPIDGTIVFLKSLNITLGGKPSSKCSGSSTVFKGQKPGNWDDPTNWETLDSSTNAVVSTATLAAADRLPCSADTVRFLPQTAATVQLNRPVTVHQFIINNQVMGPATLSQFLSSKQGMGQFRLPSSSAITLGPGCAFGSLCRCGNIMPDVLRSVCSYSSSCSAVGGCIGPVMLAGDCCAVCGAIMNISSTYLDPKSLDAELGTKLNGMQYRAQVIDSTHVQVLIVGNKGLAKAQEIKAAILLGPSAFGLNAKAQVVVSGSIVPTTQPPTVPEILTVKPDSGKCVQVRVVTDAEGREVTDQGGHQVTDIVTKDFAEPTGINIGNNAGQSGSNTGTDYTPWYVAGGVGALLVLVLVVVVVILARRREPKAALPDIRNHPVHYVHHNSPGADSRVSMRDFDATGTATQLDLYEDIKGYAAGVSNPIYQSGEDAMVDDDRVGIIQ